MQLDSGHGLSLLQMLQQRFDLYPAGMDGYPRPAAGSHARVRQASNDIAKIHRVTSGCPRPR